jgi:hypothetical protein
MGRWSIFRPKVQGSDHRVQGILTAVGREAFEHARARLTKFYRQIMDRDPAAVSDADTIEFLGRGELETVKYLRAMKRDEVREQKLTS